MGDFDEPGAFKELLGEIKLLRADIGWIRGSLDTNTENVVELFERLRRVENDIAAIKAGQKPTISWPAVVTIVISALVALVAILDRIYVNQ